MIPLHACFAIRDIWNWDTQNACRFGLVDIPISAPLRPHFKSFEGDHHFQLKHSAQDWLHGLGFSDAALERHCGHKRADVWAASSRVAVECGNTEIREIISAASRGITTVRAYYKNTIDCPDLQCDLIEFPDWEDGEIVTFVAVASLERAAAVFPHLGATQIEANDALNRIAQDRMSRHEQLVQASRQNGMSESALHYLRISR